MKEIVGMWRSTKMCALTALTAAVYAAVLIPFKPIPIIPGFTEIRPASVLPVVCSLLFGPAAAWGAAFGNIVGDLFGTLGPGSLFGFVGNFLYGLLPYKLWRALGGGTSLRSGRDLAVLALVCWTSSVACGVTIGWGVDLLGFVPFGALGNIIWVNNFLVSMVLGPVLLRLLWRRAERWGLLYTQIVEGVGRPRTWVLGLVLLVLGTVGGLVLGNAISLGVYKAVPFAFGKGVTGGLGIGLGLVPFVALTFAGAVLL